MCLRDPDYLSRANDAQLAVDHLSRGFGLIKKERNEECDVGMEEKHLAQGSIRFRV
jgi:hypothetical protein